MPRYSLKPVAITKYPISITWMLEHDFLSSMLNQNHQNQSVPITTRKYFLPAFPDLKYYLELKNVKNNETGKNQLKIALIFKSRYQKFRASSDFVLTMNEVTIVGNNLKLENYGLHQFQYIIGDDFCSFGKRIVINLHGSLFFESGPSNPIYIKVDRNTRNDFTKHDEKDCVICVENKEFKIHKYILQQHFLFLTTEISSLEIHGFDQRAVKMVINLCYGIKPKKPLTIEEYIEILRFSLIFDMEQIKSVVKKSIVLTPANICEFTTFAAQEKWDEFLDECLDYMAICLQHSYPIKGFETLQNDVKRLLRKKMMTAVEKNKAVTDRLLSKVKDLFHCCFCL